MIEKIMERFERFDGSRSRHVLFRDWVDLAAISISNQVWFSRKREEEYLRLASSFKKDELREFAEMTGLLALAFEDGINDYLGEIYMRADMGRKETGQFFTPFHVAEAVAKMTMGNQNEKKTLNEPAAGGGGMVLAMAKAIKEAGGNYQDALRVTAMDLDRTAARMTYVQLSLAGIDAKVARGDSLSGKAPAPEETMYTPMHAMKGAWW